MLRSNSSRNHFAEMQDIEGQTLMEDRNRKNVAKQSELGDSRVVSGRYLPMLISMRHG